jgi:hypothetical protein
MIASVQALAGVTCAGSRSALAGSIRQMLAAARLEQPVTEPRRVNGEIRRYWMEGA